MHDHSEANIIADAKQGIKNNTLSNVFDLHTDIAHLQQGDKITNTTKFTEDMQKASDKLHAVGVLKNFDIVDINDAVVHHSISPYKVESVAERPELTNQFIKKEGWTGADAAYSIALGGNRTLWLFGDTILGKIQSGSRPDLTMIHNSGAFQNTDEQLKPLDFFWNTSDKIPESLFKPQDPNDWYWPGDGVSVNGKLYIFLHEMNQKPGDTSTWGFEHKGDELAQIDNPMDDPSKWQMHLKQLPEGIQWGNATVSEDGFIYAFGEDPQGSKHKHPTVLARLATDKLDKMDMDSWEYWCHGSNGSEKGEWRTHPSDPITLFDDGATEMTVSRVRGIPGYFATYTSGGLGKDIVIRHADHLEGPWGEPQTVFHCPDGPKGSFEYAAKAHPELASKDGELVITYCRNSESLQDLKDHPDIYVPHAITVMLSASKILQT